MSRVEKLVNITSSQLDKLISSSSHSDLRKIVDVLDDKYYNGTSQVDDWIYDKIKDSLPTDQKVGSKLRNDEIEVELPFWLGSLDKIKPENQKTLDAFIKRFNDVKEFIVMDKLDGISCLLHNKNNEVKLYTRGDGKCGKDITYIAKFINYIPDKLPEDLFIRGELIMTIENFKKLNDGSVNPRTTVCGLVKAKTLREPLKMVDFIAYEIITHEKSSPLHLQLKTLSQLGFKCVENSITTKLTGLSSILENRKQVSKYMIDGIVIQTNCTYDRNTSGNPNYAFAFKEDSFVETIVEKVLWKITKSGKLKPTVEIKPVFISGATLSHATCYNAKFIESNKIGVGAKVVITRSGEVIPKIVDVIEPSEESGLPKDIPFVWGKTNVDIYSSDELDRKNKIIKYFMKTMDIQYISDSTINKMVEINLDTIQKIIKADKSEFYKLESFKDKSVEKIYNSLHDGLKNVEEHKLMAASGCFGDGLGFKKLEILPQYLHENNDTIFRHLMSTRGISEITANKIVDGLDAYREFKHDIKDFIEFKNIQPAITNQNPNHYVFTGFRNKELEKKLVNMGHVVSDTITKQTTHLIVKDLTSESSKITKAKQNNIIIEPLDKYI